MHSQFFVCKLINAATAPTEEQLSEGGALAGRGGHTGSAAALEDVQGAICLHGVSMCFSL